MTGTTKDLINYRLERAKETLEDAKLLAENNVGTLLLGDYADLFDFTEEKVTLYFEPVEKLIELVEKALK
jgi:hypothetical protein